jgi:hypothetical protein
MGANHLIVEKETTWGTFVTPTLAVPVEGASINPNQPLIDNEDTGGGRGQRPMATGELSVNGPINMKLYPRSVPFLLATMFRTRAKTAAGTGWRNKILPDDDLAFESVSMQKRYSATLGESIRGGKLNTANITVRSREYAKLATTWVAKDAAVDGDFWWGDPSLASPAVIASPTYESPMPDPFKFDQGVLRIGGTVALTAGEIIVTSGVERCEIDNVAININNNLSADAYGICLDDPSVQSVDEGRRQITVTFEPNFTTVESEFWLAWKDGTPAVLELFFQGAEYEATYPYQMKVTLPNVRYSAAANPELNATYGLKRTQVTGMAFLETTINKDIGVVLQSLDDLTAATWAP